MLIKVQEPRHGGGKLPLHPRLMEVVYTKWKEMCQGTVWAGTSLGAKAMGASHEGWQGRALQPGPIPPPPDRDQGRLGLPPASGKFVVMGQVQGQAGKSLSASRP